MTAKDLNSKTVTELRSIAIKAGITIQNSWKKADIVKALAPVKSSASTKKSLSKQKKKPATKKSVSRKVVKKTPVKKSVKKSTKKVKKAAGKTVKKETTKITAKKIIKKTLKKVQKKTSLKPTAKKISRTASGKSGAVTVKKTSTQKKQVLKSEAKAPNATTKKAITVRKSAPAKTKTPGPSREKISRSAVQPKEVTAATAMSAAAKATRVSLLVVNPYKLFAFWEINENDLDNMVRDGEGFSFLLRVYFFRDGEQTGFFDVKISEPFGKKYIEVIPERGYQIELLLIKRDASYSLARSSVKYTPAYRIDKEFSSPEESEIYLSQVPRAGGRISS